MLWNWNYVNSIYVKRMWFNVFFFLLYRSLPSLVLAKHTRGLKRRYMSWQKMKVEDILPSSQTTDLSFIWGLQMSLGRFNCLKKLRWLCLGTMLQQFSSWYLLFLLKLVCFKLNLSNKNRKIGKWNFNFFFLNHSLTSSTLKHSCLWYLFWYH